jgi:hypothetical protein
MLQHLDGDVQHGTRSPSDRHVTGLGAGGGDQIGEGAVRRLNVDHDDCRGDGQIANRLEARERIEIEFAQVRNDAE